MGYSHEPIVYSSASMLVVELPSLSSLPAHHTLVRDVKNELWVGRWLKPYTLQSAFNIMNLTA
jgi:hypothetical protein